MGNCNTRILQVSGANPDGVLSGGSFNQATAELTLNLSTDIIFSSSPKTLT